MPDLEITDDGWIVNEPWLVQKLISHATPPPYSYWDQIRQDAKSWIIIAIWTAIALSMFSAFYTGWYLLLLPGIVLLHKLSILCRAVVSNFRNTPLVTGIMEPAVISHPLGNAIVGRPLLAVAEVADGRTVSLTISDPLVQAAFRDADKAEVLFLDNPRDDFPLAIGRDRFHAHSPA